MARFPVLCLPSGSGGCWCMKALSDYFTYKSSSDPVTLQTCYDLASLTKVLATTTAWALFIQNGQATLDDRIDRILEELRGYPVGAATVRQLLTHSSGLPDGVLTMNGLPQ